jgi:hypothetical protein
MPQALLPHTNAVNKLLIRSGREEKLIWSKLYATKAMLNGNLTEPNIGFRNVMTSLAVHGSHPKTCPRRTIITQTPAAAVFSALWCAYQLDGNDHNDANFNFELNHWPFTRNITNATNAHGAQLPAVTYMPYMIMHTGWRYCRRKYFSACEVTIDL